MKSAEFVSSSEQAVAGPDVVRVLVVGQTPPPIHGQSLMIKMLLDGQLPGIELHHVRMAFSDNMNQVGRVQVGKVAHLIAVVLSIVYYRFRYGTRVLYYPPAGPNLVPLLRDIAILLSTRWLFARTVFHFQASGVGELISKLPFPIRWLARYSLAKPHAAVQLSELTGSDASALEALRVYTIPNAVHDEAKRMQYVRRRRADGEPLNVLYVGTVCEGKGVLVLLDSIADAIRAGLKLELDIVGSFQPSDFRSTVERYIERLGVKDFVRLWGQQTGKDKWERFANADVFCFPSHYESESFPCVLLEAMSFSLPVVSTMWRGIPSIVKHGETGFLVSTHDHLQISVYLQSLAEDADLCLRLGEAGRQSYAEHFTVEKYIAGIRNTFLEIGR